MPAISGSKSYDGLTLEQYERLSGGTDRLAKGKLSLGAKISVFFKRLGFWMKHHRWENNKSLAKHLISHLSKNTTPKDDIAAVDTLFHKVILGVSDPFKQKQLSDEFDGLLAKKLPLKEPSNDDEPEFPEPDIESASTFTSESSASFGAATQMKPIATSAQPSATSSSSVATATAEKKELPKPVAASAASAVKINVKEKLEHLERALSAYVPHCRPQINGQNLRDYYVSEDFARHAKTARVYYNGSQLSDEDALRITFQREPTNIAMGSGQYNKERLKELYGFERGVFTDPTAKKSDGKPFKDLPNTACMYAETYLWKPPGGQNKVEIACLSVPAPAMDSKHQPHYPYYMGTGKPHHPDDMGTGKLNTARYENEMEFLFKTVELSLRDNVADAFNGKGIKRVIISRFGQGVFLNALGGSDKALANAAFDKQLAKFMNRIQDLNVEIKMSEYNAFGGNKDPGTVYGDILDTAQEGDLVINAWDPHSAPGNGNDADKSFDGAMGKGTGILLTQSPWFNEVLKSKDALVAVTTVKKK